MKIFTENKRPFLFKDTRQTAGREMSQMGISGEVLSDPQSGTNLSATCASGVNTNLFRQGETTA